MNKNRLHEGQKAARNAIFHLIGLGLLKLITGLVTGMSVLIADAISTFADTLGVFASYFGLKLSRKSADKNFEYGYYKIETFTALLVSLSIILAGTFIIFESMETIKDPIEGKFRPFAITTTVLAIFHSRRLSKKLHEAGKKTNSLSLLANARDKKMDVFAEIIVLISILANYRNIPYVEGAVTFIIGLIIIKVGLSSSKESLFFLLDYWNDPLLTRRIKKIFKREKDLVLKVKRLRLRRAGTFIFGEAFIELNPYAGMQDLREELDLLQSKIEELDPYIKDFSIYTHITKTQKVRVAVPISSGKDLKAKVASTVKQTKAYLIADVQNGKIKKFKIKKLSKAEKKPIKLAEFLVDQKVNIVINNKLHSLIYYNLRRIHHILVYPNFSDINKADQTIKLLLLDT